MTPTLMGRLQTRIFLAATVGVLWTAAITPVLPRPAGMSSTFAYHVTFRALGLMTLLGLGWEAVYHIIQQSRWDKDWPSVFALLVVVPEAIPLWYVTHILNVIPGTTRLSSPIIPLYTIHVGTTWLLTWLFMQGPLRVMHLRWRFEGGKVLALAPGRLRRRYTWPNAVAADTAGVASSADAASAAGAAGTSCVAGAAGGAVGAPGAAGEADGAPGAAGPAGALGAAAKPADVAAGAGPVMAAAGPAVAAEPGTLAQVVMCGHGHVSHPQARYCAVCGAAVLARTDPVTYGRRPPAGILILADGSTAVLDHDLTLTAPEPDGELAFLPAGEHPRTVAQIKLVGWQPVVSSPVRAIWLFLPGGSNLRIEPNVPVPLVPGAELALGRYRLRYESPHQGWPAGPEPSPVDSPNLAGAGEPQPHTVGRRRRRAAAAVPAVSVSAGQIAAAQTVPTAQAAAAAQAVPTAQAAAATQTVPAGQAAAASSRATARWVPRPEGNGRQAAATAGVTAVLAVAIVVGFASKATDQHGGSRAAAAGLAPMLSSGPKAPGRAPSHTRTRPAGSSFPPGSRLAAGSVRQSGQSAHQTRPGGPGQPSAFPTPSPPPSGSPSPSPSPSPTPSPTRTPHPHPGNCPVKLLGLLRVCL